MPYFFGQYHSVQNNIVFLNIEKMKQIIFLILLVLLTNKCSCQTGFPRQFQATLNISGLYTWPTTTFGVQQLLHDYINSRVRFDITGRRANQSETYMVQYQPKGAEAGSVSIENCLQQNKH